MTDFDDLAGRHEARQNGKKRTAPPRGTPEAARWIAETLGWQQLGITLEAVHADGHEPGSGVALKLNTGRGIRFTVTDLFSRARFQAALGAALHYGAPLLKQDLLNEVAGAILGLATVREMFSSLEEANSWGTAYLAIADRLVYDDTEHGDAHQRWQALNDLQHAWRQRELPPPGTVLVRTSDGGILVVRSWFHYEVRQHLGGDRGLSAQRIATLIGQAGWGRPAPSHWKVAAQRPGSRSVASVAVYLVPADWESQHLEGASE